MDDRTDPDRLAPIRAAFDAAEDWHPPAPPPERAPEDAGGDALPPAPPADIDQRDPQLRACAALPYNDMGNGRRLHLRFGERLLYIRNMGWCVWDGTRFRFDDDEAGIRPLAHATVDAMELEQHVIEPTDGERAAMAAAEEARRTLAELASEAADVDARDKGAVRAAKKELAERARRLEEAIERGKLAMKAWAARVRRAESHATSSGNTGRIDGMLHEAQAKVSTPLDDLDGDPLLVNVLNGTLFFGRESIPDPGSYDEASDARILVWRAGIRPHAQDDRISKRCEVVYCPEKTAPVFDAFLARILPNAAVRQFVQRWFGYTLLGLADEQAFCIFHGEGRNGKSTLVDIIAAVMGDYATTIPIASLVTNDNRKGDAATPDLVRLPGARFVRTSEPKEGLPLDEALVKELTGGEPINIRRMHKEFQEVRPVFKLTLSCNKKPVIKGTDLGIWRRTKLVPFEVIIPKEEVDLGLKKKLKREFSGILNWLIAGACDYLDQGGLNPPPEVQAATDEYREESDVVGQFVQEAIEVTRSGADVVEAGALYKAFELWCERSGRTVLGKTTFHRKMPPLADRYGFEKGKSSVSVYIGIRIRSGFRPGSRWD